MKVALGVVSPKDKPITDVAQLKDQTLLVNKGTTADAFFTKSHPEVKLLKFDQNTETFDALKDGRGVALAHDNALLWAWAKENPILKSPSATSALPNSSPRLFKKATPTS